ncbi:hypothetical protein KJ855_00010 [Patescibacteria group bacterium]|nr:hypothetical protein [Patescibacteria group bacterium]
MPPPYYIPPEEATQTHTYTIKIRDVDSNPIENALIHYTLKDLAHTDYERLVKDTTVITSSTGEVYISMNATADPQFIYSRFFSSSLDFKVSKDGYYSQTGNLNVYEEKYSESETITMIRPKDYLESTFSISNEEQLLQERILSFIDIILLQSLISDCVLKTRSVGLCDFKEKSYLTFNFNSANTYNSLKLNKYDIGKTLFDEVIRKILTPLNDQLGDLELFFGYDLTVIGHTKDFSKEFASSQDVEYRFLIPSEIVKKYKQKDISGQEVLDASIILMDDERIQLKLQ